MKGFSDLSYWTLRIRKALVQASIWHEGQRRKEANIPSNAHFWGVSLLLALSGADEDTIIGGIFHDTLEDTPVKPEILGYHFGAEVLRIVLAVTEPPKPMAWQERKQTIISRVKDIDKNVKLVKCADKLDNLQSINEALKAEGFREGRDSSRAKIWLNFTGGYEKQEWYNQEILKALIANIPLDELRPIFGTYMRLVELVFRKQVIFDEVIREKLKST
ncbi:MAG: HD domain-containing protein [Candidatus Parcubacteria bacterium]|nr:HD domain-containing protein [Candidatus Parcubacteria bacterium]